MKQRTKTRLTLTAEKISSPVGTANEHAKHMRQEQQNYNENNASKQEQEHGRLASTTYEFERAEAGSRTGRCRATQLQDIHTINIKGHNHKREHNWRNAITESRQTRKQSRDRRAKPTTQANENHQENQNGTKAKPQAKPKVHNWTYRRTSRCMWARFHRPNR